MPETAVIADLGSIEAGISQDGKTVNRRFRAKVIRAATPQDALGAVGLANAVVSGSDHPDGTDRLVRVQRQDPQTSIPTTVSEIERHTWGALHDELIPPPYNILKLSLLEEGSDVLRECADAMGTNIEGFGYSFKQRPMPEQFAEDNAPAIDAERRKLDELFKYICIDTSFTQVRVNTRRATELTGNGYWELIRDPEGEPSQIVYVPPHEIAIGKTDKEWTPFEIKTVDTETFEIETVLRQKRFRRFAQIDSNGKPLVWLKEFRDPRQIDRRTGKVHDPTKEGEDGQPVGDLNRADQANEIIHFKIHSDVTPYGVPRWIGRLIAVLSNRKAEEVNFFSIDTHIPSLMIMVEGGQLSDDSIDRLTEMIESQVSMSPNRTAFVILEAENADNVSLIPGQPGAPKLSVKELHQAQISEELYGKMTDANQQKVIRAWRLPQLFVGREQGLTKANGIVSRQLANEQVFAPERSNGDWLMDYILLELGVRFHMFRSRSPNITDNSELIKLVAAAEKSGGMSPRRTNLIMEDVLETPLGPLPDGINPDVPYSLQFAQAQNAMIAPTEATPSDGDEEVSRSGDWLDEYLGLLIDDSEEEGES